MVMGGDSSPQGCGFDSQNCILDGHFLHKFAGKMKCLFEKTKIKEKEVGDWPIFLRNDN